MPGSVIGISMGLGFPGNYARNADYVATNKLVSSKDTVGPSFGDPCIINGATDTVSKITGAFTMGNFYGIAVRNIKTYNVYESSSGLITSYAPGDPCDVLRRGTISVVCGVGTPTAGAPVYVRTVLGTAPPANAVVGGFEAAMPSNEGAAGVQLTTCSFETGEIDANNVTEVRIKTIAN